MSRKRESIYDEWLDEELENLPDYTDERRHKSLISISHKQKENMNPYKIYEKIKKEK